MKAMIVAVLVALLLVGSVQGDSLDKQIMSRLYGSNPDFKSAVDEWARLDAICDWIRRNPGGGSFDAGHGIIQVSRKQIDLHAATYANRRDELNNYIWAVIRKERNALVAAAAAVPKVIQSNIIGEFEGWDGDTVVVLDNGGVWKQVDLKFHYHYSYRPKVTIIKDGYQWKMLVEGSDELIQVEQLK